MNRPPVRRSPSRPAPPRAAGSPAIIAAAVVFLALVVWLVWPSPYGKVANLDSHGKTLVAFGDSLTAGYGAGAGEDYPSRLSSLIDRPVINAGVSGDTTDSALARIDTDVVAKNPRVVIVGLGGNDYLRGVPITTTEANLRTIIRRLHAAGAMVVVLGFAFPTFGPHYDDMYARVASDERCLLIAGVLRGILTDNSLKSDAIHPNAKGYELMAERIAGPVKKLLRKAG